MQLTPGHLFAGRFRIERLLGEGGMGQVYLVRHAVLDRHLALKLIRADAVDEEALRRFEREAQAVSRIDHPNVVAVYDYGLSDAGEPYLALEYVEGPTLRKVLAAEGALAVRRAVRVLSQIAGALAAAHARTVIHRDLKPSNVILVRDSSGAEQVKILDFGLARIGDARLTALGVTYGTPEYMSPEHCRDQRLDGRSDLYSVGMLAFALLAGRLPFTGSAVEVIRSQIERRPPPPSSLTRGEIPPALDALVLRCLEKDPERRFPSAAALAAALDEVQLRLDGAPRAADEADGEDAAGALLELAWALGERGLLSPAQTLAAGQLLEAHDAAAALRAELTCLGAEALERERQQRGREARLRAGLRQFEREILAASDEEGRATIGNQEAADPALLLPAAARRVAELIGCAQQETAATLAVLDRRRRVARQALTRRTQVCLQQQLELSRLLLEPAARVRGEPELAPLIARARLPW